MMETGMKFGQTMRLAAAFLLLSGCGVDDPEHSVSVVKTMKVTAVTQTTRTTLDGVRIRWSARDRIGVWSDLSAENGCFVTGEVSEGASSAEFTGDPIEGTRFYAYYPYSESVSIDRDVPQLTMALPSVQQYADCGSFASGSNPMVASGESPERMVFRSVCGVIRLQLTGSATVRSIRLEACGGECLAGEGRIDLSRSESLRTWEPVAGRGASSLLLDCAPGVSLDESLPTVFVFVVPAGTYREGIRFAIFDTQGGVMYRRSTEGRPITVETNHIKTFNPFDYAPASAAGALDAAGTANCYAVSRGGTYSFDATVMGNGAATPARAAYRSDYGTAGGIVPSALHPVSAGVLWQTAPGLIRDVSLDSDGRIRFSTADPLTEGNAVIAAYDRDGAIVWSWHIWLTGADLEGALQDYPIHAKYGACGPARVMDRNLGAHAASETVSDVSRTYGMFYQWGRKDPFVPYGSQGSWIPTYDDAGTLLRSRSAAGFTAGGWYTVDGESLRAQATVAAAIAYPMCFVTATDQSSALEQYFNWIHVTTLQPDDLWGCVRPDAVSDTGVKTIYDPCPPGYRVAHRYVWAGLADDPDAGTVAGNWHGTASSNGYLFSLPDGSTAFYPAAGYRTGTSISNVGRGWSCWANAPVAADRPYASVCRYIGLRVGLLDSFERYYGCQVRCIRE